MDSLTYSYTSGTNRLSQLSDIINVANYSVDLDSVNNYTYDESGNLKTDAKERITAVTWSPYGKIKNIAKSLDTVNIAYSYDASMNRVLKKYTSASDTVKTYYIRDAQGNVLAVYTIDNDSLRWSEQHLYGSTRLGLIEKNILLNSSTVNANKPGTPGLVLGIKRNERRYELTNHLSNVLSVISDVKRPKTESSNTYYDVDRIAVNDYYPFGMQMPGRKQSLDSYRFGFNGKENDNEVKGEGNQQDYGMRIYDPRVGRFLSVDPISAQYPELTPYQFASNRPIDGVDMDGLEWFFAIDPIYWSMGETMIMSSRTPPAVDIVLEQAAKATEVGETIGKIGETTVKYGGESPAGKPGPYNPKMTGKENYANWKEIGRVGHEIVNNSKAFKDAFSEINRKLGNIGRPDGWKYSEGSIRIGEIKGATRTGIKNGLKQLNKYGEEAKRIFGDSYAEQELWLYRTIIPISYTVKKGDCLYNIAKAYGTTVDNILNLNSGITNPAEIKVGQEVKLGSAIKNPATNQYELTDQH